MSMLGKSVIIKQKNDYGWFERARFRAKIRARFRAQIRVRW